MSKYIIRPIGDGEQSLFFAMSQEEESARGYMGHIRMDFGKTGDEFWNSWWPRMPNGQIAPALKNELNAVMDQLRETVLSGMVGMRRFCADNGGYMDGGSSPNYGYIIDTPNYRYCLRCNPMQGDYNAYLMLYDKQAQSQYAETSESIHNQLGGMQMGGM